MDKTPFGGLNVVNRDIDCDTELASAMQGVKRRLFTLLAGDRILDRRNVAGSVGLWPAGTHCIIARRRRSAPHQSIEETSHPSGGYPEAQDMAQEAVIGGMMKEGVNFAIKTLQIREQADPGNQVVVRRKIIM
jgi:hypothetical protein